MSTEPYVPDRGTVRYRYVDGDYSGGNRDPHAEFDRFVAKIKADALREAAGATRNEAPGEPHAGSTFNAHANWLDERAERIEEEA